MTIDNNKEYIAALESAKYKDGMGGFQKFLKRFFDIVLSAIGLVVLLPLQLVIIVAMLISDRGPIIFKQERIGYKGKPFMIYKYRTMKVDAEANGIPRLECERNAQLTRIGSLLRAYHLDEFPQLWNVLKGDMSIVGPRPERQYFIEQIYQETTDYRYIYLMRPGLSSYAAIYNGYTDTIQKMLKRLEMDIDYLEHRSVLLDTKIILKTISSMLSGRKF